MLNHGPSKPSTINLQPSTLNPESLTLNHKRKTLKRCVQILGVLNCRGTSLIRNSEPLGPYSRTMRRALWWPPGEGLFLVSGQPLNTPDFVSYGAC